MPPPRWACSQVTNDTVLDFYDEYCKFPYEDVNDVNHFLESFLEDFERVLWKRGLCGNWQNAGSAFDRCHTLRLDDSLDVELDKQYVLDGSGLKASWDDLKPGWAKIWNGSGPAFDQDGGLSKNNVRDIFEKVCKKYAPDDARFSRQGPAITMWATSPDGTRFSLDMVPSYSIPGMGVFVPKPGPGKRTSDTTWKESFIKPERDEFPDDSPRAKSCLRILKVVRDRSPELRKLKSYPLKNLLFMELKEKPDAIFEDSYVGRRVWCLLHRLENCLDEGCIPQFFNKDVNLIEKLSDDDLDEMQDYVEGLCADKEKFLDAFRV